MKKGTIAIMILVPIFAGFVFSAFLDEKHAIEYAESLHPRVQASIADYLKEQPQVLVGDFVNIKNHDDQTSSRTLVVTRIEGNPHSVPVVVANGPGPNSNEPIETIRFYPGVKSATKAVQKMDITFIRKGTSNHGVIAYWYWLQ